MSTLLVVHAFLFAPSDQEFLFYFIFWGEKFIKCLQMPARLSNGWSCLVAYVPICAWLVRQMK